MFTNPGPLADAPVQQLRAGGEGRAHLRLVRLDAIVARRVHQRHLFCGAEGADADDGAAPDAKGATGDGAGLPGA